MGTFYYFFLYLLCFLYRTKRGLLYFFFSFLFYRFLWYGYLFGWSSLGWKMNCKVIYKNCYLFYHTIATQIRKLHHITHDDILHNTMLSLGWIGMYKFSFEWIILSLPLSFVGAILVISVQHRKRKVSKMCKYYFGSALPRLLPLFSSYANKSTVFITFGYTRLCK